jgi:hypothetical protein
VTSAVTETSRRGDIGPRAVPERLLRSSSSTKLVREDLFEHGRMSPLLAAAERSEERRS